VHADMGLQFPLNISYDVLNVGKACLLDLFGNIVALETILQVSFSIRNAISTGVKVPEGARFLIRGRRKLVAI